MSVKVYLLLKTDALSPCPFSKYCIVLFKTDIVFHENMMLQINIPIIIVFIVFLNAFFQLKPFHTNFCVQWKVWNQIRLLKSSFVIITYQSYIKFSKYSYNGFSSNERFFLLTKSSLYIIHKVWDYYIIRYSGYYYC